MRDDDRRTLRAAEDALDPTAEARRLANGDWSPTDSPEDAKEFLEAVAEVEAAHGTIKALTAEERADKSAKHSNRARAHKARAKGLQSIRRKLRDSADGHARRAAGIVAGREHEHLPTEEYRAFANAASRLVEERDLDARLKKQQRRHEREAAKERRASVTREPKLYSKNSPNSWFADVAASVDPEAGAFFVARGMTRADMSSAAVNERLAKHAQDVRQALLRRSKYGRRVDAILREQARTDDVTMHQRKHLEARSAMQRIELEARSGLTTGGGTTALATAGAAAFLPPAFVLDLWAPFRGSSRTFADQAGTWPLPDYGMEVYVPAFQSATAATQQVEGSGVSEADPVTGFVGAAVQTIAGQVTITQQVHDRGYTGGGSFDVVVGKQLRQQLDQNLDAAVLSTVIAGGASVAGNATFSIPNLYQDMAKGREQLSDTAGVRLRPTHFFSTSDFYAYVTRQVDSQNRPIVVPTFAPGFPISNGADDGWQSDKPKPAWARFTGTVLPGGVLWFTDDNIPPSGSNTQLVVSAPDEAVVVSESDVPILTVYPETFATSLGVVVNLRSYVAAILRHASGTATIVGNGYTTALI